MNFGIIPARYAPYLLSLLRIVTGLVFMEHGTGKLLHFPVLPGLDQMPAAAVYGTGTVDLLGGLLILAGLFTRPVAFVLSGFMAAAYWLVHVGMGGIFPVLNGGEPAVLYCFAFLYFAAAGAGPISIDAALGARNETEAKSLSLGKV